MYQVGEFEKNWYPILECIIAEIGENMNGYTRNRAEMKSSNYYIIQNTFSPKNFTSGNMIVYKGLVLFLVKTH